MAGSLKTMSAGAILLIALPLHASDLPSGGTVVGGQGSINSSGKTLTVTQSSQNMAINWQDFSIAEGHTVNFNQPNAQAAALNRVTGNNVSDIRGALNANGRVFLVNPNGVMFSSTARVDVGSLVTSTLDISTDDFMAGNYRFEGASANAIINQGNITTAEGGVVAMIAAEIINTGSITTPQGSTLMGAGSKVTLDLGGPLKIEVEEALLDTYIEQGGAIRADGGLVYLTARAAGELASSVINHTGVTEARTLATGENGQIMLMGDMGSGRVEVAGTLDASAPIGGDGGFIETSAAKVAINDVQATTKAENGKTGEWLIDPTDIEIVAGSGGYVSGDPLTSTSSSIGADTLVANLATSNITVQTPADGVEEGNITVSANIVWDANTRLTLEAINEIYVNATIENTNTTGGGVYFDVPPDGDLYNYIDPVIFANDAKVVIHNVDQLQWVSQALAGNYELGSDIDASITSTWNGGLGFEPIKRVIADDKNGGLGSGMEMTYGFMGRFDGHGHTIDGLTINRPDENNVGLFGATHWNGAEIKDIALTTVNITGQTFTGALVGESSNSSISNASATGSVSGDQRVGGLVGSLTGGALSSSYTNVDVTGNRYVGGLVGQSSDADIANTYALGTVSGPDWLGGLVGALWSGSITDSYASGSVSSSGTEVGGLVGYNDDQATITDSYFDSEANTGLMADSELGNTKAEILNNANTHWDSSIWKTSISGADYAGYAIITTAVELPVQTAFFTFTPTETLFEGGMGVEGNAYTITNWNQLQNINFNTDILTSGYHFVLSNGLDASTFGYNEQASAIANGNTGWTTIGTKINQFTGTFDGQGNNIESLTIDKSTNKYIGLFGSTNGAQIKNINLLNANVTGQEYVGGLIGEAINTQIENASFSGEVSGNTFYVGGLIGYAATSDITESHAAGKVIGGATSIGGLAGYTSGDITNSYAVTQEISGDQRVGGLVGFASKNKITNSYSLTQSIASNLDTTMGGLVGLSDETAVTQSYWNTETSGLDSSAGGEGKTTAEMQSLATFNDGSTGWNIEEDANLEVGSPVLAWTMNRGSSVWIIGTKPPGSTDGGGNTGGGGTGGTDSGDTSGGNNGGASTGGDSTGRNDNDQVNQSSSTIAALQQSNSGVTPATDFGASALPSGPAPKGTQASGGLELVDTNDAAMTGQAGMRDQAGPLALFVVDGGMQLNNTNNSSEQQTSQDD